MLAILKEHLEKSDESISIFITVMTETGFQSALKLVEDKSQVAFFPLDCSSSVNRFLNKIKPAASVFIETEIWPNMIDRLGKNSIPIFLANGRLSEKSCRSYVRFKKPMSRLFDNYNWLMVQSEDDKNRYMKIGAPENKIEVAGNLKFDATINTVSDEQKQKLRNNLPFDKNSKIFIAGSTRKNENEIILRIFKRLTEKHQDVNLILVPRHPEKINEAEKLATKYELAYCLYSECKESQQNVSVVIIDEMGLLNHLYAISDIAFVGGTLADIGGQNILEPVWAGIPVLYGPSIYNVRDSSEYILENQFGTIIKDGNDLFDKLSLFFGNELTFQRKNATLSEKSRAHKTARTILENL